MVKNLKDVRRTNLILKEKNYQFNCCKYFDLQSIQIYYICLKISTFFKKLTCFMISLSFSLVK